MENKTEPANGLEPWRVALLELQKQAQGPGKPATEEKEEKKK